MNKLRILFANLSTRNKLISGFIAILLVVAIIEYNEHHSISRLGKIQTQVLQIYAAQRSVKNAKLYVVQDLKVMHQILHAENAENLERYVLSHSEISNSFQSEMKGLIELSKSQGIDQKFMPISPKSQSVINDVMDMYQSQVKPSFEQLKQLKQESFTLEDDIANANTLDIMTDSLPMDMPTSNDSLLRADQIRASKITEGLGEHYKNLESYLDLIYGQIGAQLDNALQNQLKLLEEENASIQSQVMRTSILLIIFGGAAGMLIAFVVSGFITQQVAYIQQMLDRMSQGELPDYKPLDTVDEIGQSAQSLAKLIDGLRNISAFAASIGRSDFQLDFQPLGPKDELGNSLIEMRKSLQQAAREEERRKIEDARRNWTTEGIAKFNVILRQSTGSIKELTSEVVSELVAYIKANQAGIFVLNDKDKRRPMLELVAAYAYNRKKFIQKSVQLGEGLLGATAIEKYTVYLTEIPQDYLTIESALGGANPTSLILVPLKLENTVYGVLEIASFRTYEPFEIEFVEKVAENIASTLSTIKINSKTAELLEQSKLAATEMQEKENHLRQEISQLMRSVDKHKNDIQNLQRKIEEVNNQKLDADKREEKRMEFIRKQEREAKDRENQLSAEIKRLKDMVNLSHDGMLLLNENAVVQEINVAVERILHYEDSEIIGLTLEHFVEKNYYERINRALLHKDHALLKEIIGQEFRINIFKKDGVSEEVKAVLQPISAAGKVYYILNLSEILELKAKEVRTGKEFDRVVARELKMRLKVEELTQLLHQHNISLPEESAEDQLIQWGPEYELGLEVVDEQHRKWIEIINRFYHSFKEGESNQVLNEIIKALIDYTDYHFSFEERYFKELKYHKTTDHTASHRKFVNKVVQLQSEFKAGKSDAAYELMNYLRPWVKEHIQVDDRQYVPLFREHNVRYTMF